MNIACKIEGLEDEKKISVVLTPKKKKNALA